VAERDDGFRRLDEPSPLESGGRERRSAERLEARAEEDLAPRGVGATIDAGIDALRARFLPCLGACIVLWIGPAWLMAYAPPEDIVAQFETGDTGADALILLGLSMVQTVLSALVQIVATVLVGLLVRGEFVGGSVSLGEALRIVFSRLIPLVVCTIEVALLAIAGLVACVIPYFFVLWRLSLAPLVSAMEGLSPFESVKRSFALTQGTFLRWLGITAVSALLLTPLSGIAGAAATTEIRHAALENVAISPELYAAILWFTATLFLGVATAVAASISAAFYFDCRVRREALDLSARLDVIASTRVVGASA